MKTTATKPEIVKRPPLGLCVPVTLERTIDGDTLVVRAKDSGTGRLYPHEIHVRLLGAPGCWAPEIHGESRPRGIAAQVHLAGLLTHAPGTVDDLAIYIPASDSRDLLAIFTMGRVLAHVFAGDLNVGAQMVIDGFATGEKVTEPAAAKKAG